jgi:hypothetical protein
MEPLSPEGRALIKAGRGALRPRLGDRERIEAALRSKLGVEALPLAQPPLLPRLRTGWPFVHAAIATLGLVGSALFFASDTRVKPSSAPVTQASPQQRLPVEVPSPRTDSADALVERSDAPAPSRSTPRRSPRSGPHPRSDRLAQEVALMSRATSALRAGRAEEALGVLAVHQQRFAGGVLKEERLAAKAQALCLLGRVREGRAELSRLAPESPTASRAREVCDTAARQRDSQ